MPSEPPEPPKPLTPPLVVWTHRAERRLQTELHRRPPPHDGLDTTRKTLDGWLEAAFPSATAVVILDVYLGFRPRDHEYILFVDVRGGPDCATAIVKLAESEQRLLDELVAWRGCIPVCFRGNAMFMELRPREATDTPDKTNTRKLVALMYQDAQPHIGTDETIWLETAVLRAVQFGVPDTHTVLDAIRELFSHLGRVLYANAREIRPGAETNAIELNPDKGKPRLLKDTFKLWEDPGPVRVLRQVSVAFAGEFTRCIDPVDYFRFLHEELTDTDHKEPDIPGDRREEPAAPDNRAQHLLPRLLRGPAHGDLHGRNVLVGVDENRVGTPAVFDYENMSCDNLLGWDFVKLETELKIRALAAIIPHGPQGLSAFAARVQEFETQLADRTHECRRDNKWPEGADLAFDGPQFARLAGIVLCIRQQAEAHLGARRKRYNDWLHEYYFLLGCYGLTTVRFDNQSDRERAAALVSAGAAAYQYHHGRPGARPIGGAP